MKRISHRSKQDFYTIHFVDENQTFGCYAWSKVEAFELLCSLAKSFGFQPFAYFIRYDDSERCYNLYNENPD